MLTNASNLHLQTDTQLELAILELRANVAHLQEVLHNLGPAPGRQRRLVEQRALMEAVQRELSHRCKLT